MSQVHLDAFERIRIEYQEVERLLTEQARRANDQFTHRKDPSSGKPLTKTGIYESAVATASDAYALLLIATAEGFMRTYLLSLPKPLDDKTTLDELIRRCRKECNLRNPGQIIQKKTEADVHNLKEQRNTYAHGRGSGVFPSVSKVASILGCFFADIP